MTTPAIEAMAREEKLRTLEESAVVVSILGPEPADIHGREQRLEEASDD
jgi:hypothetical protein